jgi:hypothetical protein
VEEDSKEIEKKEPKFKVNDSVLGLSTLRNGVKRWEPAKVRPYYLLTAILGYLSLSHRRLVELTSCQL